MPINVFRYAKESIGRLSIELQKLENESLQSNRRVAVPVFYELSGCFRILQTEAARPAIPRDGLSQNQSIRISEPRGSQVAATNRERPPLTTPNKAQ